MTVVGYIRCSHLDQVRDGETLERQEEQIRQYCERKGFATVEIIRDEALSGYRDDRPGFQRIVKLCRSGEVDTLVIYDLSRLSRSIRTTLMFIEDIIQRHKIDFVCLRGDIDTSTPMGRTFVAILAVLNEHFRNEIQYRTKAALDHKRSKGEKLGGNTPYGFDVVSDGRLAINDVEARTLRTIQELHAAGKSLRQIANELHARQIVTKLGLEHWSPQTIKRLLDRGGTVIVSDRRGSSDIAVRSNGDNTIVHRSQGLSDGGPTKASQSTLGKGKKPNDE